MSTPALNPPRRSRWLDWQPKGRILGDLARSEPTKPTKPHPDATEQGFVGFVGAIPRESSKIAAAPPASLPNEEAIPWAEWRARSLNKLFQEQGATGQPGRIREATVRHGYRRAGRGVI